MNRLLILSIMFISLLAAEGASAQSFFRKRDKYRRTYIATAVTAPVPKPGEVRSLEAKAETPVAVTSRQDMRRSQRQARREQRRAAKIDRQAALAKGMQERTHLGDAIVDHTYREEHTGR